MARGYMRYSTRDYDDSYEDFASARARSYRADSDSEADLYVDRDTRNQWNPLSSSALRLQDPFLKCDRDMGWNIEWAVAFIVDRLDKRWLEAAEKFQDIRVQAAALEDQGYTQEIPYRIFNSVDDVLFAGYLKDTVFLDVGRLGSNVSGATYTPNLGPNPEVRRISIFLNRWALDYSTSRDVIAILIHHMIHAYFLVACGPQEEDEVTYGRLSHGIHFSKIMGTIRRLSAAHGRELGSLSVCHKPGDLHHLADEPYYPRRASALDREEVERWYHSHCHDNVKEFSKLDVYEWYARCCKPMLDLPRSVRLFHVDVYDERRLQLETKRRAQLPDSVQSVEFVFNRTPVLVDRRKIESLFYIRRAFTRAKCRFVYIPRDIGSSAFCRFLEFIHTGSYRRVSSLGAAVTLGRRMGSKESPVIKSNRPNAEASLLYDVQFAKLGSLMGFEECKTYGLSRMYSYSAIYEDPVTILQEIYHHGEPDVEFKTWTRRFLVQAPAPSSPNSLSTSMRMTEPPNLIKLESEHGPYRRRFLEALNANGALEIEVNRARSELRGAGWYGLSPLPSHNSAGLIMDEPLRFPSPPLPLNLTQPSHFLLRVPRNPTLNLWPGAPVSTGLSTREMERAREREHDILHNQQRVAARELERERRRDQERERDRVFEIDRERERAREAQVRAQTDAALERFYRNGLEGFVLDD